MRGYFAVGVWHPKTAVNVGTLWRTAESFGAAFMFTVGRRFPQQPGDTTKAWRRTPMLEFVSVADLVAHLPYACPLVGVENCLGAKPLEDFTHPERACYLLGAEDSGLSRAVVQECHKIVILPGTTCHNVAVAGAMVMHDRASRRGECHYSYREVVR